MNPHSVVVRYWKHFVENPPTPNFLALYAIVAPLGTLFSLLAVFEEDSNWLFDLLLIGLTIFCWYLLVVNQSKKRTVRPTNLNRDQNDTSDTSGHSLSFYVALGLFTTALAVLGFLDQWVVGAIWTLLTIQNWFSAYVTWWRQKLSGY